jgi:hypothetical protein
VLPSYWSYALNYVSSEKCTAGGDQVTQYAECGGALCSYSFWEGLAYCQCRIVTPPPGEEFCSISCEPLPPGSLTLGSARKNPLTGELTCRTIPDVPPHNRCDLQRQDVVW